MLSLEMLDVAIGMIFIFLFLSLICTAAKELVESVLKVRAVKLEQGIRELLNDPKGTGLAKDLWNHQLVYSLFKGGYDPSRLKNADKPNAKLQDITYSKKSNLPSYVPSRNFALALMDILLPAKQATAQDGNTPASAATAGGSSDALSSTPEQASNTAQASITVQSSATTQAATPNPLKPLRDAVDKMDNVPVKTALLTIIDAAGNDAAKAREGIENWYNSAMDRISGWYKRHSQNVVLVLGFILVIALNADAIAIFKNLANDRPLRNAIVAQAQNIKEDKTDTIPYEKAKKYTNALLSTGLPLGWGWKSCLNDDNDQVTNLNAIPAFDQTHFIKSLGNWLLKTIGWLITGLAITLGAPFWFDTLNKVMVVRSTVKPTEKSPDEASEDRKKS